MKKISLKIKRRLIKEFISKTNKVLASFEIDFKTLSSAPYRKTYKMLKTITQFSDSEFDKKQLKIMARFISEVSLDFSDKGNVKKFYNFISRKDIYKFIKTYIDNVHLLEATLLKYKNIFIKEDTVNNYDEFIEFGILRI